MSCSPWAIEYDYNDNDHIYNDNDYVNNYNDNDDDDNDQVIIKEKLNKVN